MHGNSRHVDVAQLGECRANLLGHLAADATGDHHDLAQQQPALDDLAQPAGVGRHDADAVDLGAGVTRRGGQGVGVDVVDPPLAGVVHLLGDAGAGDEPFG